MTKSISQLALFVIALGFCACGGGSSGQGGNGLDGQVSTAADGGGKAPDGGPMTCGGPGFGCCAGNACHNNGCCVLGVCAAPGAGCGSLGGTCDKGACGACGGAGQACCATGMGLGTCTAAGTKCQAGICIACGNAGLPCCEGAGSNACLGVGLACNGSTCVAASVPDAGLDAAGGAGGDAAGGSTAGPLADAGGTAPDAGAGKAGALAGAGGTRIPGSGGAGGSLGGTGGKVDAGGRAGAGGADGAARDGGAGDSGGRDAAADAPINTRDGGDAATANCPAGCSPGQACVNGVCAGVVCTPSTKFCQGSQVLTCSAAGDSSSVSATCTSSQYCDTATATCKAGLCAPNQPACNGKMATTCNADGTGFLAGGIDCTANDMRCNVNQGTCQPIICSAGTSTCEAGAVYKCGSDGTTRTLSKACLPGEYCAEAQCKPQVCTPSAPLCNNTTATTCKDDGSGIAPGGTDCSTIDSVCVDGACKERICSPNRLFCDTANNVILRCTEDGLSTTLNSGCKYSEFCDSSTVQCKKLTCIPNQPTCFGTIATTCNAMGSGTLDKGTDCLKSGLNCRLGACVAEPCVAGSYFCDSASNAVYVCPMDDNATTNLVQRCDPSYQFCDTVGRGCVTMRCKPGEPTCNGDLLSTCKPDGSGNEAGGTDCTASGQMCVAGACVSQSIESVGKIYADGDTSGTNLAVLNTYAVDKSRTLVAIEQAMTVSARTLTFLVFDCGTSPAVAESGRTATPCTAIESLVSNVDSSSTYVRSGAMSVPLVAGRKYMISAWWSTKATFYIDSHTSADDLTTSFATFEGAFSLSATTAPITTPYTKRITSRYPQKLHIAP